MTGQNQTIILHIFSDLKCFYFVQDQPQEGLIIRIDILVIFLLDELLHLQVLLGVSVGQVIPGLLLLPPYRLIVTQHTVVDIHLSKYAQGVLLD